MWSFLCCKVTDNPKEKIEEKRKSKKVAVSSSSSLGNSNISDMSEKEKKRKKEKEKAKAKKEKEKLEQKVQKKDVYDGQQFDGKPHGNGIKNYVNGDYYRGEWVNGLKEGRGIHSYFQLRSRYEGEWKKNLKNGHGKYIEENGSYFEGEFKDGVKHGKGTYFDNENQILHIESYDNGKLIQRKELKRQNEQIEQEFPTLVLDKQRFNTQDLVQYEKANPQINELQLDFLLKYYGLCKVINLDFIEIPMSEWTIKQVHTFLAEINLESYKEIFYENKIKGKDLLSLEEDQMKSDLNMKLGDRKRLISYIQYISSLDKRKKEKEKRPLRNRKGSFGAHKYSKYYNIRSIDEQIIEEDEEYMNESQNGNKIGHQNFVTEEWDKFNSNAMENYHSLKAFNDNKKSHDPDSQASIKGSEEDKSREDQIPNSIKRKRSEDRESLVNSLGGGNKQREKSVSSSSESTSSDESAEEAPKKMKRKKTSSQPQELRELFQFLKEHQSLDFIIKPKDIEIIEQIGEGGYGKVYRGKYISCPVAVKDYIKTGRRHKSRDDFMKEVQIFSDLKHPNIVLYMGMCITANQHQLVTEYMDNGSLFDQLHKKKTKFTPEEQLEIIDDIVRGMVYLHNMKNMLHRDLKSSNVLIAEDWKVKLCDFGLSGHKKKSKKKRKNKIGTYQWMAPQVIRNEEMDFFSDVYSFGVIIWEILTEKIPYEGLSEAQINGLIGYDEHHKLEDPPEESSQFIVKIMDKCLNRNPSERPTFIQIQKQIDNYRRDNPLSKDLWQDK